ncbi:MAG: DUF2017 family protein [Actinomycetota bacterium]
MRLATDAALAVRQVAEEVLTLLEAPEDEGMYRLFPPAYADDANREEEFRRMTRDDLIEAKKHAARVVIAGIDDATRGRRRLLSMTLDEETVGAWLGVCNDARLVLGTRIGVAEDAFDEAFPSDHPDAPAQNMYLYLSALVGTLSEELLGAMPGDEGAPE